MNAAVEQGDPLRRRLTCPHCEFTCSGPSPLAAHLPTHGLDKPTIAAVMLSGYTGGTYRQCGEDCSHGSTVGAQWREVRFDGHVSQHEKCPSSLPFADRFVRTSETAAYLQAAAAEARAPGSKPPNPTSHRGALQVMLLNFADAASTDDSPTPAKASRPVLAYFSTLHEKSASHPPPEASSLPLSSAEHDANCATGAARELEAGHPARAANKLLANPTFKTTPANEHMVRDLFPPGENPLASLTDLAQIGHVLSTAEVFKRVMSRSPHTAPGPAGLSIRTLQQLVTAGEPWLKLLTGFLQAYSDGWFRSCPQLLKLICTSVLTLIQKGATPSPNARPRPIGVQNAVFNIARGIAASQAIKRHASDSSIDFGLSPSDGTGRHFAHVVHHLDLDPAHVVISLDCANAFNSILRSSILSGLREHDPALIPPFLLAYGEASTVCYDVLGEARRTLPNTRGVTQGDPLGPILFMMGTKRPLTETRDLHPNVTIPSYLDDMNIVGPAMEALAALDTLKEKLKDIGLSVNLTKTKLYSRTALSADAEAAAAEAEITVVPPSSGITLVGIPLGSPEFVAMALADRTVLLSKRADALLLLSRTSPDLVQNVFRILLYCIAPANNHLLRALEPAVTKTFAEEVDALCIRTALALLELPGVISSPDQVRAAKRLQLPREFGGVGLGSARETRNAAYIAGAVSAAPAIEPDFKDLSPENKLAFLDTLPGFTSALDAIVADANTPDSGRSLEEIKDNILSLITNPAGAAQTANDQDGGEQPLERRRSSTSLQRELARSAWQRLNRDVIASEPDPHMQALQRSFASDSAATSHLDLMEHGGHRARLSSAAFRTSVHLQIGAPRLPRDDENKCFLCHQTCGSSLVHALMCMSRTGTSGRGKRHSHVQHTTEHAIHQNVPTCTIAPGAPSYDTFFQRRGAAPANGKIQKADFLISYGGKDSLVDINISGSAANIVAEAAKTGGAIAKAAESRKRTEVTDRYIVHADQLHMLKPFVLEFSGAFGPTANKLIRNLVATVQTPEHLAAVQSHAAKRFHLTRVCRIKTLVAAAVHRSNHALVAAHVSEANTFHAMHATTSVADMDAEDV